MSVLSEHAQITFAVEVGPENRPVMKVRVKEKEIPLGLSPAQAGELGRALLAASAICSSPAPRPQGTRIDNCHFPVVKWATGRSQANGLLILVLETVGGTQLAFQFDRSNAEACATSLRTAAQTTG